MSFLLSLPPDGPARDNAILAEIEAGHLDPVTWVRVEADEYTFEVSADYLSIDGEHVPMAAPVAQRAVDVLGAYLPTPAIVDAIEEAAALVPMPTWTPEPGHSRAAQTSAAVFAWAEQVTRARFAQFGIRPGQLVAGHRKDVVLDDVMPVGKVVIYGGRWTRIGPRGEMSAGARIQDESRRHERGYEDYSHGVRAVRACWKNGDPVPMQIAYSRAPIGPVARMRYLPDDRPPAAPVVIPSARPTPVSSVLHRGSRGDAVRELQRGLVAIGYELTADGIFGPKTEDAVKRFQRNAGLTSDGIAGPETLAALIEHDTDPAIVPQEEIPFVQAHAHHPGRRRALRLVVLHVAQLEEVDRAAENLAKWASRPDCGVSWHYAVDNNSTVQCVRDEDTAFHAKGANADGLGIEMAGFSEQDANGWADAYSTAVLERTARLVKQLCEKHGLPKVFLDAEALLRGDSGITTHHEVTKAYKMSTHTDPGKAFPLARFMAMVGN